MCDPYGVSFHDTSEKHLFRLANWMKSRGCGQVEHSQRMAALLLYESPAEIARGISLDHCHDPETLRLLPRVQ
jgi:murein L,D-transpeptidase YcbB/YkuD